jgi:hypothetical protein
MMHSFRPFSRRRTQTLLGAVVAISLLPHLHVDVAGGAWVATARAQEAADTCAAGSATLAGAVAPEGESPPGFVLDPLGEGAFDRLPPLDPPPLVRLQLSRLSFAPLTDTGLLQAAGPSLYYVESGELAIAIDGTSAKYGRDTSLMIPEGKRYQVQNDTTEPATVLGLALASPGVKVFPVANVLSTPTPVPPTESERLTLTAATSTLLFHADLDVGDLPDMPARLFLGCAAWTMPPDANLALAHPGPVALRVVSGTLLRDDTNAIVAGGCTSFAPGRARPTGAADQPASVILFGILPVDQELWQPVAGESTGSEGQNVDCGVKEPGS